MKVIQTHYKGHFFRSRLEARYAVMFDAAGLEWVYEPEGYELPSGRYLPDFYIPKWDAFVEIKGKPPGHPEFQKCYELSVAADKLVILFEGQPETELYDDGWEFTTKAYIFNATAESTLFLTSYILYDEGLSIFSPSPAAKAYNSNFVAKSLGLPDVDLNAPIDRRKVMDACALLKSKKMEFYLRFDSTFNICYQYGFAEEVSGGDHFKLFAERPVFAARSARFEFGGR